MTQKTKQIVFFLFGLFLLVLADQWTKYLAVLHLKKISPDSYVIADGVFELLYHQNEGAAFGMLQGRQGFFFIIGVVVILFAAYTLYRMPVTKRFFPLTACLLMITAGAIGNMIDRIVQGYVVDFLYFKLINFPIFNVADCYVTISACLLVYLLLFFYKEEELEVFSLRRKGDSDCQNNS